MKKIKRGLWIVFAFNLLVGVLVWWAGCSYSNMTFKSSVLTESVRSVPDLTVKEGTIIAPLNVNTQFYIQMSPYPPTMVPPLTVYVQTDRDYVGVGVIQDGIYITRKAISLIGAGNVLSQWQLRPHDGTITPAKIVDFVGSLTFWASALLGLLYMLRLWIFYLLLTALVALVSLIPALRKKLAPYAVWRYAMWAFVGVLGLDFVANYFGHGLPVLTYYNFNLPTWLGLTVLFFVSMFIQLAVAWLVSVIIMLISVYRNKNKKKKG